VASPFVVDAVEEFLRLKAARAYKTRASYSAILLGSTRGTKPTLGIPLASYFHNRRFDTVSEDEVAAWFGQRVAGGAQATKHRVSKGARAFFRFVADRGYSERNLGAAIEMFPPGGPRLEWLEWKEVHGLLGAMPEYRYRLAIAWLFWTGCRVGEACRAKQKDVQWREDVGLFQWAIPETKTHVPRLVWLPDFLANYVRESRALNKPGPTWPVLWDCSGRGFARVEDPSEPISPHTINAALERAARVAAGVHVPVTAHVARHSYCTNWIREYGSNELAMEKLSRQVGTSPTVLRQTYVHLDLRDDDWLHLKTLGAG